MRSFDIFDTILARRCIEPRGVFELTAQRIGFFAHMQLRIEAEQQLQGGKYALRDIYQRYAVLRGLPVPDALKIADIELALECENAILVKDVYQQVQEGDLLITDMYLSVPQIERVLQAAGADKFHVIIQSNHGKASGEIWPSLKVAGLELHHGDNAVSDVLAPRRAGIKAVAVLCTQANAAEQKLRLNGLPLLAQVCRAVRLGTLAQGESQQAYRIAQTAVNLPLLCLSAVILLLYAQQQSCGSVLFASRDSRLWLGIAKMINRYGFGERFNLQYFYTSRLAKYKCDEAYKKYCAALLPDAILADLCGTGHSNQVLQNRLGFPLHAFFVNYLGHSSPLDAYPSLHASELVRTVYLFEEAGVPPDCLEMLNYALHPSVLGVKMLHDGVFIPEYAESLVLPLVLQDLLAYGHHLGQKFCCSLNEGVVAEVIAFVQTDLSKAVAMCHSLYADLLKCNAVSNLFQRQHDAENVAVVQEIWSNAVVSYK